MTVTCGTVLVVSVAVGCETSRSLIVSVIDCQLCFVVCKETGRVSCFVRVLLASFFSFLYSFVGYCAVPCSSRSPGLTFLGRSAGKRVLISYRSPIRPAFIRD